LTPRPLFSAVRPDGHFKDKWHDISHENSDARRITRAPRNRHSTSTRVHILNDFQEYTTQYNIGANTSGTAIVARDGINLENIILSPSGRTMAAKFREMSIINVYTPSGTAMKREHERFFNSELTYKLTGETGHILLGGDFNCILEASDTTGGFTYSRPLAELVHGLALTDTWLGNPTRNVYTRHSAYGATRIDRIYATRELLERQLFVEAIVAPFTDHLAVCLRI